MFRYHPIGIVGIPPTLGKKWGLALPSILWRWWSSIPMPRMFFDGTYHPKNLRNHIRNDFPKRKKGWSTAINKPPGHQKKMITTSRRDLTRMMGSLRADYPKVAEVFRLVNYHNLPRLTITQKDVSCIPVSFNITIRWSAEELQKQELPSGVGRLGKRKWRWNPPIWVNHGQFHSISLFPS